MAKSETQRQRDRRRRIAAHLTILRVEVPMGPLADLLVDTCFLPQWDLRAVGEAFSRVVQLSFSPEASQRDAVSELARWIEHALTVRGKARMTAIRANIVGPPSVATS